MAAASTSFARDAKSSKENRESVEAHRRRKLRRMFTISSNSWLASQVQESKMVFDGVPASVR